MAEVPDPFMFIRAGVLTRVQFSEAGKPLSTTLPVGRAQVGWVMVPTTGAAGVTGWVLMTTFPVGKEVHPLSLVTVKV